MSSTARTFYDVLGIERNATTEEVRKAYKQQVLRTHPDKLGPKVSSASREVATFKFQQVCKAFEVLGDPIKRRIYDNRVIDGDVKIVKSVETLRKSQEKRAKEREAWAKQAEERRQERLEAFRAKRAQTVSNCSILVDKVLEQMATQASNARNARSTTPKPKPPPPSRAYTIA